MKRSVGWLGLLVFCFSFRAEARVFSFDQEFFSTYWGGTFGLSKVQDSGFGDSSGTNVTISRSSTSNASGEFGVLFSLRSFNLKIGGELIVPKQVVDAVGTGPTGSEYFTMQSKILALTPSAYLEFPFRKTPTSRALWGLGVGWSTVSLDNDYHFTTLGLANYPGVQNHIESASGQTAIYTGYLGYEMLFTDTTTVFFNIGYRSGVVRSFASTKSNTAITGPQSPGTELVNNDGSRRTVDLSGGFVGLSFRFYL